MLFEATYLHGTHRLIPPEETLARIAPHLERIGITRCADVTRLDQELGVPTYCAIRPGALTLQASNGKGLTHTSAKVSGLMEATELFHAEQPEPGLLRRSSLGSMTRHGLAVVRPEKLEGYSEGFFSDDYVIDWVEGENLISGARLWAPASTVYFGCEPALHSTSTNGLASGNHLVEATLHALYELIERDAVSGVSVGGRLKIREWCRVIDPATITGGALRDVVRKIEAAETKLVLLWVRSGMAVHTFWAILLNHSPFSPATTFNDGFGTHLDIGVAAARAVTEAVQARLTVIHGSREDINYESLRGAEPVESSRAFKYFDRLAADSSWDEIEAGTKYRSTDLLQSYEYVLSELEAAGHDELIRFDLTKPEFNIPVVKIIAPSLRFNRKLI